jgi:proteasome lid subunit RPN8/RPN11
MVLPTFDPSQRTRSICRLKGIQRVLLRRGDWQSLSTHAIDSYPGEAVGILSGFLDRTTEGYFRLINRLSNRAFEVYPESLAQVLVAIEAAGSEPLVFCHSHPDGRADLSELDVKALQEWPSLIGVMAVSQRRIADFRVYAIEGEHLIRNIPVELGKE